MRKVRTGKYSLSPACVLRGLGRHCRSCSTEEVECGLRGRLRRGPCREPPTPGCSLAFVIQPMSPVRTFYLVYPKTTHLQRSSDFNTRGSWELFWLPSHEALLLNMVELRGTSSAILGCITYVGETHSSSFHPVFLGLALGWQCPARSTSGVTVLTAVFGEATIAPIRIGHMMRAVIWVLIHLPKVHVLKAWFPGWWFWKKVEPFRDRDYQESPKLPEIYTRKGSWDPSPIPFLSLPAGSWGKQFCSTIHTHHKELPTQWWTPKSVGTYSTMFQNCEPKPFFPF